MSTDPDNLYTKPTLSDPKDWLKKHGNALFGYALRCINNQSIAEDLVQETLLAALKGRVKYAGASSERTWLIGILKNKVADHFRKCSREMQLTQPELYADSDDSEYISTGQNIGFWQPDQRPAAWSVDPNDPVEQKQFWQNLQNCLEGLDDKLARVYTLRDMMEFEYKEVCNVLSVTPTNLRVMLHRARKLLRRCLEKQWIDS